MEKLPEKSAKDIAHSFAKGILSAIPYAGGPMSVLFDEILQKPLDKRRTAWLNMLASAIEELQEKMDGLTSESLASNEMFVTALIQASQIAQRTHQNEKIEALRNAVQNSALNRLPDEDLQLVFLRYIDELTQWHLQILSLLDNPTIWIKNQSKPLPNWGTGGVHLLLEYAFPDLQGMREFSSLLVKDLQDRGMLNPGSILNVTMTLQGIMSPRTTPLGKQFLSYITKPKL